MNKSTISFLPLQISLLIFISDIFIILFISLYVIKKNPLMKKNFLVTTSLIDSWETDENNFILGRWCEFHEKDDNEKSKHYTKNVEKTYSKNYN